MIYKIGTIIEFIKLIWPLNATFKALYGGQIVQQIERNTVQQFVFFTKNRYIYKKYKSYKKYKLYILGGDYIPCFQTLRAKFMGPRNITVAWAYTE